MNKTLKPKDFYDIMSKHYDAWMLSGESTLEDEIRLNLITFPEPCKILDVGSGTGRIAIALQEKGYDLVGVDISRKMIEQAVNKGLKKAYVTDFLNFEYESESFDGIISLHTGFSYTNNSQIIRSMIKKCKTLLTIDGQVLWDTPNKEFYGEERILKWPAGKKTIEMLCYGHDALKLKAFFEEYDFEIKNVWGSYTPLKKFENGLPRIIINAIKKD